MTTRPRFMLDRPWSGYGCIIGCVVRRMFPAVADFVFSDGGPGLALHFVTRYAVTRYKWRNPMAFAADRMKAMRERRRARGLRELRVLVPAARSNAGRRGSAKR